MEQYIKGNSPANATKNIYHDQFLMISNHRSNKISNKEHSSSPAATKSLKRSQRDIANGNIKRVQASMERGDSQALHYKTSETFKLKSDVEHRSDENYPQVVEEEQTTTENLQTGQTERI